MDKYRYDFYVDYSRVDNLARLSLDSIFQFTQIAVTEYFKSLGFDNRTMKIKYNYAWVFTKVKAIIKSIPYWDSNIYAKCYVTNIKPVKADLETVFYDSNDKELFCIKDEMCVIDLESRKIKKLSDFGFDKVNTFDSIINGSYEAIDESNLVKYDNLKVKFCDIDVTNHVNNVSYIRFIMNSLGVEFLDNYDITAMDFKYHKESRINEELELYKNSHDDILDILIKRNDDDIFSIKIKYKEAR